MIKFRAWDGLQWWYEGEMNGYEYYRCIMEKNGINWKFTRSNMIVAQSDNKNHILEYSIDGYSWNKCN